MAPCSLKGHQETEYIDRQTDGDGGQKWTAAGRWLSGRGAIDRLKTSEDSESDQTGRQANMTKLKRHSDSVM